MLIRNMEIGQWYPESYDIENEQEFETLALCGEKIKSKFCTFLDNEKYVDDISENAVTIITTSELAERCRGLGRGIVITANPRWMFFAIHNFLSSNLLYSDEKFKTVISSKAQVSELAYVAQENVIIGDNTIVEPFVTIYPNVIIGKNVIIRSGARIGGEGFEFKKTEKGNMAVIHAGRVRIEDNVEIQNNTCIDKAVYPWDETVLEEYVKVDDLVYIAHGVKIRKGTMIAGRTAIGGRTIVGSNTWIGLGVTIRNGISIGEYSRANMGAVVTKSVKDGVAVSGNFAIDHKKFIEQIKKNSSEE